MVHSFTRGHVVLAVPSGLPYQVRRYYQKLSWVSSTFAFWSDVAMGVYGGKLKFAESITGRFADIFNWMYLITCALRRFEAEGRKKEHLPFLEYIAHHGFSNIQKSFEELFANLEIPLLVPMIRGPLAWWIRVNTISTPPSDKVKAKIAKALQTPGELRDHLTTHGLYIPKLDTAENSEVKVEALARIDHAFEESFKAKNILQKIRKAIKAGDLPKNKPERSIEPAREKGIITEKEATLLARVEDLRSDAVTVDSFTLKQYKTRNMQKSAS